MLTVYKGCPDGQDRALYYKFTDGVIAELSDREGELPEAEFRIIGDYETFAKISRAELGSTGGAHVRQIRPQHEIFPLGEC